MGMPKLDDLLLPFLTLLVDGQVHTHDEIFNELANHFQLSETQRTERTKGGIPRFENLIAWCKAYCTMGGFTEQLGKDGLRLTSLGSSEVQTNLHKINVTYMRSFGS